VLSLLAKCISPNEQIQLVSQKVQIIVTACYPNRIVLIGSAARLAMNEASDVDFIVIVEDGSDTSNTDFRWTIVYIQKSSITY
jgi:predicted nucleotidyltransferase